MLTIDRPQQIKPSHLSRKAIVYVRQSTERQVLQHQGSAEYQRRQADHALRWGWPRTRVEVIDDDLGQSGMTVSNRAGYLRMLAETKKGEVGIILVADLSRGGREAIAWFSLLNECGIHDVLIADDGKVYDMRDHGSLLVTRIGAVMADHENRMRRQSMLRGRIAKARTGKMVNIPPTGYIRLSDGSLALDPNLEVQSVLREVFQTFLRQKTIKRAVRALIAAGVKIPRSQPGRALQWAAPTVWLVQHLLKNPTYAGEYRYPRRIADPALGLTANHRPRMRRARPEEMTIIPNNHPAYVSPAEWEEIRSTLEANRRTPDHEPLGGANTLLQGILRCGRHRGYAYYVHFNNERREGGRSHRYRCHGDYMRGGKACDYVPGAPTESAVVKAVIDRLSPMKLELLREAIDDANDAAKAGRRALEARVRRAEETVEALKYRYLKVDPDNRLVAVEIEAELEKALHELSNLQRLARAEHEEPPHFDEKALAELIELTKDLQAIFDADTTTNQERKTILRMVMRTAVVEERTRERVVMRIEWQDGHPDTIVEAKLPRFAHTMIEELGATGMKPAAIALKLNELGLRTERNRLWADHSVRCWLARKASTKRT